MPQKDEARSNITAYLGLFPFSEIFCHSVRWAPREMRRKSVWGSMRDCREESWGELNWSHCGIVIKDETVTSLNRNIVAANATNRTKMNRPLAAVRHFLLFATTDHAVERSVRSCYLQNDRSNWNLENGSRVIGNNLVWLIWGWILFLPLIKWHFFLSHR